MALTDRREIREILSRHSFSFSKALGQNFLVNPTVCPRMAEVCEAGPGVGVLEIGPGIGVLTRELALRAQKVVCIEIDKRLPPILAETLRDFENVTVLTGDAMELDLHQLIAEQFEGLPVAVCANLPYYITTPIIMRLLEERLPIQSLTLMVQKEAATRLCASPGERDCGAISAAISYYSRPQKLFTVAPDSFVPPPSVESQVISLAILPQPPVHPRVEANLFVVVKAAFSQRRKRVANSLSSMLGRNKAEVEAALESAGIDQNARAEQLSLQQLSDLSDLLFLE